MRTPNGTTYRMFRCLVGSLGVPSLTECQIQERQARTAHTARDLLIARALWSAYRAGCC